MKLTLRPYQTEIVDFIIDNPRCNLFVPMGAGKTVSVLTALDHLSLVEDVFPAAVFAPKRVAMSTWPTEVEKFEHLNRLRVSVVVGTPEERRAALRKPADIYCINYDVLEWVTEHLGDRWPFNTVVADECSRLKGFRLRQGTRRAKALGRYVHSKAKRYIGLTGTPASNGLKDLWAVCWFVDKGERLGRSFDAFQSRWFRSDRVGDNAFAVQLTPLPFAQEQIQDRIRDVCLSIDLKQHFDFDDPIVRTVRCELPRAARVIYDDMEKRMFAEIEGIGVEAFMAATKTMKCLQIASGAAYVDDKGTWKEIHDAKIEALESIVEEANGMPVLVAYHWKPDLARLLRAFPKGRHLDARPETIRDWNAGKIPILFAHPQSAGHGLNLQDGGNILVYFSHWWSMEERLQILERIGPVRQKQSGHDRPVWVYNIIAHDTVDEDVIARQVSKKSVQDALLDAMKRRK